LDDAGLIVLRHVKCPATPPMGETSF
jgi:hypothetical protein